MDGVIVVDKPSFWTSHDVVGKMRRIAGTKRVGHLGTLDPLATGVLPLVLERATRLSQFLMKADKVYEAEVTFGFATNTYDSQGTATSEVVAVTLDAAALERELAAFRGGVAADAATGIGEEDRRGAGVQAGAEEQADGAGAGAGDGV